VADRPSRVTVLPAPSIDSLREEWAERDRSYAVLRDYRYGIAYRKGRIDAAEHLAQYVATLPQGDLRDQLDAIVGRMEP